MTDQTPSRDGFDDLLSTSIRRHHAGAGLDGSVLALGGPDDLGAVLRRVDARRSRRRTTAVVGSFAAVGAGVVGLAMLNGPGDVGQPVAGGVGSTTPPPTSPSQRTIPAGQDVWECLEQIDYHGDEAVDSKYYVSCTPVTLPIESPLVRWTPIDGLPALVDQQSTIPATTTPAAGRYYVVQEGDTLAGIAVEFGVTETAIVDINQRRGLPVSEPLTPGDEILVPVYEPPLMATTTTIDFSPTVTAPDGARIHVVVAGDNPANIAARYGITLDELDAANAGNPAYSRFLIGDEIVIPAGGGQNLSPTEQTYTVVAGDSVYEIAARFDIEPVVLANYNGWEDGVDHPILVGETVMIPPLATIPTSTTPTATTSP